MRHCFAFAAFLVLGACTAPMSDEERQPPLTLIEQNPLARTEVPSDVPYGTIVVDTPAHYLYFGLGDGKAMRYSIGVGRDGFRWSGMAVVARKQEWPDWYPPAEMLQRQPYLPTRMAGGLNNPLGARALYLFQGPKDTGYRIHGTNDPSTIGKNVSSGCIRLTNEDIEDLYKRVQVGEKVAVLQ